MGGSQASQSVRQLTGAGQWDSGRKRASGGSESSGVSHTPGAEHGDRKGQSLAGRRPWPSSFSGYLAGGTHGPGNRLPQAKQDKVSRACCGQTRQQSVCVLASYPVPSSHTHTLCQKESQITQNRASFSGLGLTCVEKRPQGGSSPVAAQRGLTSPEMGWGEFRADE